MKKKFLVVALALVLALAMTTTVFADTPNVAGDVAKAPIQPPVKTAAQKNFEKKASYTEIKNGARVYAGKDYIMEVGGSNTTNYVSYRPTANGYFGIYGFAGNVTLCNSSKKAISDKTWVNSDSTTDWLKYGTFAVKKNTTYYIRFNGAGEYIGDGVYAFGFHIEKRTVKEYSGSKKSTSKTIKRKTRRHGTVLSGGTAKADYYKLYSSNSKLKIYFMGDTSGTLRAKVTHKYKGQTFTKTLYLMRDGGSRLTVSSGGKGTWYVKVYRDNIKQSGHYYLEWK